MGIGDYESSLRNIGRDDAAGGDIVASNPDFADGSAVSVSRIFNRAFAVIRGNPATIFAIALLLGALPQLGINYLYRNLGTTLFEISVLGSTVLGLGLFVITIMLNVLVQAGLIRATMAHVQGTRASLGECLAAGLAVVLPLVGLAFITGLALMAGFLFFVVPGVILYLMWSVSVPALVDERLGVIAALGRSRRLTKGARWKIFAVNLLMLLSYWLLSGVAGVAALTAGGIGGAVRTGAAGPGIGLMATTILISTIVTTIWATVQTSIFVELRDWKDGPQSRRLADIFA